MGEDLEQFLEEQRAKLAQDKAELEKDPPYMEIRSKRSDQTSVDAVKSQPSVAKENLPPNWLSQKDTAQVKQTGGKCRTVCNGLSLPLGEEYERKKHKLKQELRQDYRRYLNQGNAHAKRKKHFRSTGEVDPATQGMSLPIGERLSGKERLRLERNKEYNQFLKMKEEDYDAYRIAAAQNIQNDRPVIVTRVHPEVNPSVQTLHKDQGPYKKDASTSIEAYEQLLNKRRSEEDRYRKLDVETEAQDRRGRKVEQEMAFLNKKYIGSDGEDDTIARHSHNVTDRDYARKLPRFNVGNNIREDIHINQEYEVDSHDQRQRYSHPDRMLPKHSDDVESLEYVPNQASYFQVQNRSYRDRRHRELPTDYEDDFREQAKRRPVTSTLKSRFKTENLVQTTERSKSAHLKEEGFSTGLLLGGSDRDEAQQRRKEQYRQDLMEQMAEQQRNKRREKELGLKVAASGAIDPEKQQNEEKPDRLRQFGAISRQQEASDRNIPYRSGNVYDPPKSSRRYEPRPAFEERALPERPRVAFQTPAPEVPITGDGYPGVINSANEEYHRDLAKALGEIVVPRIAAIPPPQPPVLKDNYRTPYDDAYYFYGARNPLDPNLAYYHAGFLGPQSAPDISMPAPQTLHKEDQIVTDRLKAAGGGGTSLGFFPENKPAQSKQTAQSYQEELQRQIWERNEKRRKEKEEQEQYDAKVEADMKNYNPWGKGGGGAPLKDSGGKLITDLKRMHKLNEDAYQQPEGKAYEDKRSVVAVNLSLADNSGSTSKIPGFAFANASPYARGSVFAEPPTENQVQEQESYKNFLRLQIEEKRHKEEEERDRIRQEEEREERRLADQRAKIQREYEAEQNKKKLKEEEQRQKNEELIRLADERRKEAERKRKEEEAKQEEELRQFYEQEKSSKIPQTEPPPRQPSPVIPALQHKASARTRRPPTADSQISIQSNEDAHSRPLSPPVPARRNQLRAYDEKRNVISELSELRKQLRSEQRRLEGRLQDADRDDDSPASMSGRRAKNSVDVFDLARQRLQATVRRPSLKGTDNINMQNIREFNDLKYRDTDTREGVRFMYPDPPKDDQTLEIQQQALLREQQRKLNKMKRRTWVLDDLEPAPVHSLRHTGMFKDSSNDLMKTSLLESESAFIGENGEPFAAFMEPPVDYQPVPSARERRRQERKPLDYGNDIPVVPAILPHQTDRISINSDFSLNVDEVRLRNEERLRRLSNLQKSSQTMDDDPDALGDAEDILKLLPRKSSARPQSVDTVATDPWLRPGTSETLKRFMAGQLSHDKPTNENALSFNWQGLSTAHG
ncbi:centrosome and spindle pole-associated protein 1 [Pelodytes ibericus]